MEIQMDSPTLPPSLDVLRFGSVDVHRHHHWTRHHAAPQSSHWILFWGPQECSSMIFDWMILNFIEFCSNCILRLLFFSMFDSFDRTSMILRFKRSRRQTWILSFTRPTGLWRSSTVLVTKKHCRRLSDQIVCHISPYESIGDIYLYSLFFGLLTYSLSITFGRFIKLPTGPLCHVLSPLTCAAKGAEWADSFGGPQQTRCRNHVLLDRLEVLIGIVGILTSWLSNCGIATLAAKAAISLLKSFLICVCNIWSAVGGVISDTKAPRLRGSLPEWSCLSPDFRNVRTLKNAKSWEGTKMHKQRTNPWEMLGPSRHFCGFVWSQPDELHWSVHAAFELGCLWTEVWAMQRLLFAWGLCCLVGNANVHELKDEKLYPFALGVLLVLCWEWAGWFCFLDYGLHWLHDELLELPVNTHTSWYFQRTETVHSSIFLS